MRRCGEKDDPESDQRHGVKRTPEQSRERANQQCEDDRVGEASMAERMAVGNARQEPERIDVRQDARDARRRGQRRRNTSRPESDGDRERDGRMGEDRGHSRILGAELRRRNKRSGNTARTLRDRVK